MPPTNGFPDVTNGERAAGRWRFARAPASALHSSPGVGLRRTLLVLVALAALAVAGWSVVRTVRTFFTLDFGVSWVESGVRVELVPPASTAADAGLRAGDLLVAVDGHSLAALADPVYRLASHGEHVVEVVDLQGSRREVVYHPPPPRLDLVYLARCLVAILGLACALAGALLTRRSEVPTFVLLAASALLLATIPHRTAASGLTLSVIHRMAGAAVSFLLVRFYAMFPERERWQRGWDLLTMVVMAAAAATAVVPGGELYWQAVAGALRGLFVAALGISAIFQIHRWRQATRVARVRRQIEWAALGMFVGLLPYGALVLLPRSLGIGFEPLAWLAVLPMVAVPLGMLAALLEYHLWDLEPITRDSLSATLVVVAGGLIFAASNRLLVSYAAGLGGVRNLLAFVTGVTAVLLLLPVRRQVERFLDRWLYHGHPSPRALITDSTRELARLTDPEDVLVHLEGILHDGLELERVVTYLRQRDGSFRRVAASASDLPAALPAELAEGFFPHGREEVLMAEGFALRIPLERGGTVLGLLYLGLRRGIFPLGREGREVVTALVTQAALALESARLLDDLRRQAEEYRILHANTQRIIESSAAGIVVCDAGGRILSSNVRAGDLFGGTAMALVGRSLAELVTVPERWRPHLPLHAVNAEAETSTEPQRRVVMAVSVLELDSGRFNGRVVVLQDVTEVRQLQDRLREQERLAGLGRLAAGLAHEINTPLTGIASFAQMLGEMTDPADPRAELVAKLVDQSFRVARIVANLHEAVRGGRHERISFDLREVACAAASDAARSLGFLERLELPAKGPPVMVTAAPGVVELAVSNLVRNALEASSDGPVRVTVEDSAKWGEVHVDDHGPGVPTELREKVFEPFFTTRAERGGTGLGLAITRDMIRHLGGEVRLATSLLGGTRATVRLQRWVASATSSSSTTSPSFRTS